MAMVLDELRLEEALAAELASLDGASEEDLEQMISADFVAISNSITNKEHLPARPAGGEQPGPCSYLELVGRQASQHAASLSEYTRFLEDCATDTADNVAETKEGTAATSLHLLLATGDQELSAEGESPPPFPPEQVDSAAADLDSEDGDDAEGEGSAEGTTPVLELDADAQENAWKTIEEEMGRRDAQLRELETLTETVPAFSSRSSESPAATVALKPSSDQPTDIYQASERLRQYTALAQQQQELTRRLLEEASDKKEARRQMSATTIQACYRCYACRKVWKPIIVQRLAERQRRMEAEAEAEANFKRRQEEERRLREKEEEQKRLEAEEEKRKHKSKEEEESRRRKLQQQHEEEEKRKQKEEEVRKQALEEAERKKEIEEVAKRRRMEEERKRALEEEQARKLEEQTRMLEKQRKEEEERQQLETERLREEQERQEEQRRRREEEEGKRRAEQTAELKRQEERQAAEREQQRLKREKELQEQRAIEQTRQRHEVEVARLREEQEEEARRIAEVHARHLQALKEEEARQHLKETRAATIIQSTVRGHLLRKRLFNALRAARMLDDRGGYCPEDDEDDDEQDDFDYNQEVDLTDFDCDENLLKFEFDAQQWDRLTPMPAVEDFELPSSQASTSSSTAPSSRLPSSMTSSRLPSSMTSSRRAVMPSSPAMTSSSTGMTTSRTAMTSSTRAMTLSPEPSIPHNVDMWRPHTQSGRRSKLPPIKHHGQGTMEEMEGLGTALPSLSLPPSGRSTADASLPSSRMHQLLVGSMTSARDTSAGAEANKPPSNRQLAAQQIAKDWGFNNTATVALMRRRAQRMQGKPKPAVRAGRRATNPTSAWMEPPPRKATHQAVQYSWDFHSGQKSSAAKTNTRKPSASKPGGSGVQRLPRKEPLVLPQIDARILAGQSVQLMRQQSLQGSTAQILSSGSLPYLLSGAANPSSGVGRSSSSSMLDHRSAPPAGRHSKRKNN